ncbi:hypothetical protein COCNU_scaffold017250G000020 [Cocos nucifera]|nr:hypothetical protein [Cocos nucifera]
MVEHLPPEERSVVKEAPRLKRARLGGGPSSIDPKETIEVIVPSISIPDVALALAAYFEHRLHKIIQTLCLEGCKR